MRVLFLQVVQREIHSKVRNFDRQTSTQYDGKEPRRCWLLRLHIGFFVVYAVVSRQVNLAIAVSWPWTWPLCTESVTVKDQLLATSLSCLDYTRQMDKHVSFSVRRSTESTDVCAGTVTGITAWESASVPKSERNDYYSLCWLPTIASPEWEATTVCN